jgi:hypothetical protein
MQLVSALAQDSHRGSFTDIARQQEKRAAIWTAQGAALLTFCGLNRTGLLSKSILGRDLGWAC